MPFEKVHNSSILVKYGIDKKGLAPKVVTDWRHAKDEAGKPLNLKAPPEKCRDFRFESRGPAVRSEIFKQWKTP